MFSGTKNCLEDLFYEKNGKANNILKIWQSVLLPVSLYFVQIYQHFGIVNECQNIGFQGLLQYSTSAISANNKLNSIIMYHSAQ